MRPHLAVRLLDLVWGGRLFDAEEFCEVSGAFKKHGGG
jgi:hypothetical protein